MKTVFHKNVLLLYCLLGLAWQASAQAIIINAPEPADNPNLPGNSPWTAICAGNGGFNEYFVNITWAGTANAANEFILELSDATGSFANAETLATIDNQNTNTDFDVSFAIPETTRGQGYKMRVRSTDPVRVGTESDAYNMYFMDVTNNINISELGDGVPPGSVCATGPITLRVDNIANPETYQYIWFRSGTPIAGETGHTLNVDQSGMYNAFIDYGPICTGSGNTDSNIVDVTVGGTGTGIGINPPSKTALCSTDTELLTVTMTDPAWSYQWYQGDTAILGAIGTSYTVNAANAGFEGAYSVEISGAAICTERSAEVVFTNADAYTVTRENEANKVVLPSQTDILEVSTTANNPTYQWFRNGSPVAGATNATLSIDAPGTYYAAVTQTGGSCAVSTKNSEETIVVAPESFEMTIDYAGTYTACTSTNAVLQVTMINAVASDGSRTDVTTALEDVFTYTWERNGTAVAGQNTKSLSLASDAENGTYGLSATLDSYTVDANELEVRLLTDEVLEISSTGTVFCAGSEVLTLSTATDLSGQDIAWQRDGTEISTTAASLDVTAPGRYRLVVDRDGCDLISNEIVITPFDEDVITLDPGTEVVIPEGTSRVVTAAGGTAYRWMDATNNEMSASDSVTLTDEGTYTLVASIGNCDVVRQINVSFLDTFKVPNVITVNGDGINDQWVIPNSYSNKADVNIIIYNEQGVEVLNEFDYKNNWPQTAAAFTKQNMVFYYKIRNANGVLKQGTITVIR